MPALVFNIYLNDYEKLEIFKNTYQDIQHLFTEKHIKIRGKYSKEGIDFILSLSGENNLYQDIFDNDWIKAFSLMINNVKSNSIYIFLEDHKLVDKLSNFKKILYDFDKFQLDYLCYSWYYSSHLYANNLLPFAPKYLDGITYFECNKNNFNKLKNNTGFNFYPLSICSIVSTKVLKNHVKNYNTKFKFYNKYLSIILFKVFGYPFNRYFMNFINNILRFFNARLFLCPINTPANLEVHKTEKYHYNENLDIKFGVVNNPLFAAVDDDNGHYGESLLKMGKFPFDIFIKKDKISQIKYEEEIFIRLNKSETYPLQYIPYKDRYYEFPALSIKLISGEVAIKIGDKSNNLFSDKELIISSTYKTKLLALTNCFLKIKIGSYS